MAPAKAKSSSNSGGVEVMMIDSFGILPTLSEWLPQGWEVCLTSHRNHGVEFAVFLWHEGAISFRTEAAE